MQEPKEIDNHGVSNFEPRFATTGSNDFERAFDFYGAIVVEEGWNGKPKIDPIFGQT